MKRFWLLCAVAGCMLMAVAQEAIGFNERPRLVVGIMVDQMRWDYLSRYYDEFAEGGFRRLIGEGYSCNNTMINYVPTVTAIGHCSVYTGSTPALHGIAGNNFMVDGRQTGSVYDPSVATVGSSNNRVGQASPHLQLATTIGDQLKLHTDFRSKVVGVSYKDRAAILPAGRSADAAYWIDSKNGQFVTSTYYMQQLPQWAQRYNEKLQASSELKRVGDQLGTSALTGQLITDMALEAVKGEQLGQDEVCDLLAISYSHTDAIGHEYGTRDERTHQAYLELDKQLGRLLKQLDEQVGRGRYLLFLTADHGAAHNTEFMKEHKLAAGRWMNSEVRSQLNGHLKERFGTERLVKTSMEFRFYLDYQRIDSAGLRLSDVKEEAVSFLRRQPHIVYAVDFDQVATSSMPDFLRERILRGWNPQRSGDIQVVLEPGWYSYGRSSSPIGTTHSSWNPYDAHIPLLFYGWKVPHGESSRPTFITDIAATVCAMLHIQMPNACIGTPIELK